MTHTLESLMWPILEFAEEWKRCGHLQHEKLPTWTALESALAALVQPQEPFLWARVLIATGELDDCGDCVAGKAEDLQADESDGTKAIPLYAAPAAQVECGEPVTAIAQALRNIAAAGHARDNVQRANDKLDACIEWAREALELIAAPAAQEARPACDNRGSSSHVDGDPIARGEAPEPVAQRLATAEALLRESHDGLYQVSPGLWSRVDDFLAGQPAQHKEQE